MSGLAASADVTGLIARLTALAGRLGQARAQAAALLTTRPDRVWRDATLLWPLFSKEAN